VDNGDDFTDSPGVTRLSWPPLWMNPRMPAYPRFRHALYHLYPFFIFNEVTALLASA
jgi:hypothetical protein